MMSSEVEICNLALSNIRAGSINSLNEQSLQAQICKLKYPFMRDRCLRDGSWQFNRKITALALLDTDIYNWVYAYQYPSDCLIIHRLIGSQEQANSAGVSPRTLDSQLIPIGNLRQQIPYEVFNFNDKKVIGCNSSGIRIDYAAKTENTNLYSDDFILALSHLLASEIAIPIIGAEAGRTLRSDSLQIYTSYLNAAMAHDMNDRYLDSNESDFISVRR